MEKRMHKETFHQVLYNIDNQVIVRELIETYMSNEAKAEVLEAYNADVDRYNAVGERQAQELAQRLVQNRKFLDDLGVF